LPPAYLLSGMSKERGNMIKINTLQQYEIIIGLDPIGLIQ
jgi:hypothetical protein